MVKKATSAVELGSARAPENEKEPPQETNIPETGEYSRVMKADEYREWVRQMVSAQIWRRMAATFSAVGFAAIIAVVTYISNVSNLTVEGKVATESKRLGEEIDKKLPNVVNTELANQIRTNNLIPQITKEAVDRITESKGVEIALRTLIINRSQKILEEPQSSLHGLALQQILLFGEDEQKVEAIMGVILEEKSQEQEFALALQHYVLYQSKMSSAVQRRLLHRILERAVLPETSFNDANGRMLEKLLIQDKDILEACRWIADTVSSPADRYSMTSLQKLVDHIPRTEALTAAERFAEWLESSNPALRLLGQHGLTSLTLTDDSPKRPLLVAKIARAMAGSDMGRAGFEEHLNDIVKAVSFKDKLALRRLADSEFATQRIKTLLSALTREPEDRANWILAMRELQTTQAVERYGRYGHYERSVAASRLLGRFLNIDNRSTDWQRIVQAKIAEARGLWTAPGAAQLLVNAWVYRLRSSPIPYPSSIDVAVDLFIDSHLGSDPNVLLNSPDSYRYLLSKASDKGIWTFLDKSPNMIGMAERKPENQDLIDENETAILSEALTRVFSGGSSAGGLITAEGLKPIRASFRGVGSQKGNSIWFAAVAPILGVPNVSPRNVDYYRIFSAFSEKLRKGDAALASTTALLFIVANKSFLEIPSIKSAAEHANLHILVEDAAARWKSDPLANDLVPILAEDEKTAIGWLNSYEKSAIALEHTPIALKAGEMWLSFEMLEDQIALLNISPPRAMSYIFVEQNGRVSHFDKIAAPKDLKAPSAVFLRTERSGRKFIRLTSTSNGEVANVSISIQHVYRPSDLPSAKKGQIVAIEPGDSIVIDTAGKDDAWVSLNARANMTYTFRTFNLQKSKDAKVSDDLDTEIEVYGSDESNVLSKDDDGGEANDGEALSSLLTVSPANDMTYHIRIRNIDAGRGTFFFSVSESPK